MEDRLDVLLADVRPPEPEDDGFTARVMLAVHSDVEGVRVWRHRRRFFTRPAVLASAAVLIAGGALAAVRTTTTPEKDPASPQPSSSATVTPGTAAPSATVGVPSAGGSVKTGAEAPTASTGKVYRSGDYEWGYTSPHTAYLLDRSTGLRLQTETYKTEFAVGKPARVTLTLTNTSSQPLGIYASNGCALSASAYSDDGRSADPGKIPTSPSNARTQCGGTTGTGEPERFVLGPGGTKTAEASIVLPGGGNWGVIGTCHCNLVNPDDEPGEDPVNDLTKLVIGATVGQPSGTTSSDHELFTPPIRVEAV